MTKQVTILDLWAAVFAAELLIDPSPAIAAAVEELKVKPFVRSENPPDWDILESCVCSYGRLGDIWDINNEAYDRLVKLLSKLR